MTALSSVPQSWRRLVILLPIVIITLLVTAALLNGPLPRPRLPKVSFHDPPPATTIHNECKPNNETSRFDDIPSVLRALYAPLLLPITAPEFRTVDKTVKKLPPPDQLIHRSSLGKRICILDVDTRDLVDPGDIFYKELPSADEIEPRTAGFLSHYLYAMIHGYSYRFVRAPKYADRAPHWSKVIFTQEMLKEFDVVVMVDYDVMFPSPEVPLEWLLNYWKIDRDVLVAMAEDPNKEYNMDLRGKLNVNTGFIIAQAGDQTQQLFKDWAECPDSGRYDGCAQWKDKIFHEQAAFSSHVRYNFLDGLNVEDEGSMASKYIRVLPCDEANGIPLVKESQGCSGQLVRHYWGAKSTTGKEFTHNIMNAVIPVLAKAAYGNPEMLLDYRKKVLKDDQILDS